MKRPTSVALLLLLSAAASGGAATPEVRAASAEVRAVSAERAAELQLLLSGAIDARLRQATYREVDVGIKILTLDGRHVLYQRDADSPRIPASAIKVLSSGIILIRFGADFRFETPLRTTGEIRDGVLTGDLYLVGSGDPSLMLSHLQAAAGELVAAGIRRIDGDLVYDLALLDEERPRYPPNARHLYAPPAALTVNYNWIDLKLDDGPPPRLTPIPETSYARLDYQIKVSGSENPGKPPMTYCEQPWGDQYTIRGTVTRWDKRYHYLRLCVSRPGLFAATLLKEALGEKGVDLRGGLRPGPVPPGAGTLLVIRTEPLRDAIRILNQESNNVVAELLNKDLGAYFGSAPGTRAKGLAILRKFCRDEIGLDEGKLTLADASGLATANRISPAQFTQALNYFYRRAGMVFVETLAPQGHHSHARYPVPPDGMKI
ncbi:MAG: D-alanyl-D-alanine carboxypeptidase/D-alanyl-D-alanine-endopeptidase, partial [bacterium]|nr:D-alanyl-D-alanine carboxypeptidase/D-alanyl-D-alanine-endopeptidase [bacterium]